jgi:hypothetical protein
MPLLFEDSVGTFFSTSLVFQFSGYAISVTCSPAQRPCGVASRALGWPSGDLNNLTGPGRTNGNMALCGSH